MHDVDIQRVCDYCHNYFEASYQSGKFEIEDGAIIAPASFSIADGQFCRIQGSTFNDGLHFAPLTDLDDETFDGTIFLCKIPAQFIDLCERITQWIDKNGYIGGKQSESFGGYSYSLATGKDGQPLNWQGVFATELQAYRKV